VAAGSLGARLPRGAGVRGLRLVAAACAAGAGGMLLAADGRGFVAGICLGLGLALLVVASAGDLRDAEARTEYELAKLARAGWSVEPDAVRDAAGRRGHVVSRHGRVFRLDSRAFEAVVSVDNGIAIGGTPASDLAASVRGATWSLRDRLEADVRPVVVVWAAFPQGWASLDGVDVVRGDRLVAWLSAEA
jgi:hypothetical protein